MHKLQNYSFILLFTLILVYPISAQSEIILLHEVQGNPDHPDYPDSPFEDSEVTIEAVVIGDFQDGADGVNGDINGFYVQEEDADTDDNPQSSEGIYVFERGGTVANVEIGDLVRITGIIDEIRSLTQMNATEITILSSDNPLPAPLEIAFPLSSREELEYSESMLVTIVGTNEAFTVNDTYDLGRYGVIQLTSGGRVYQYTQINPPTDEADFEAYRQSIAERIILVDDGRTNENAVPPPTFNGEFFSADNTVRSGYTIDSVTGILEFRFDEWRIHPTEPISVNPAENTRPVDTADIAGTLRVASVNLLNYFNGDGQGDGFPTARGANNIEEFERQRAKTLSALAQLDADIIGLIELENDFFSGEDSAAQDLVNGLNEMDTSCGANWAYIDVSQPPLNLERLGTDAISNGLIYCTATVMIAPDTVPAVLTDDLLPDLGLSNLLPAFNGVNTNRPPLAVTFREIATGEDVTVVVNHLKAKSGDGEDGDSDTGNGVASWNQRRLNAIVAEFIWLARNPTGSDDTDILLLGDFNAYAMEDPIQDLIALGYANLLDIEAHSYGFPLILGRSPETQGWGTLDYAFASETLVSQVSAATVLHINSDEPIYIDYNLEHKPDDLLEDLYQADSYRASDHDPVIVGLSLGNDE